MPFEIQNIVDDDCGEILCERCQDIIQPCLDELVLDMDLLYHKKCFDEHVDETLKKRESQSSQDVSRE